MWKCSWFILHCAFLSPSLCSLPGFLPFELRKRPPEQGAPSGEVGGWGFQPMFLSFQQENSTHGKKKSWHILLGKFQRNSPPNFLAFHWGGEFLKGTRVPKIEAKSPTTGGDLISGKKSVSVLFCCSFYHVHPCHQVPRKFGME